MAIEKIRIKRFRGIGNGTIDGLRRFTLLVGKSGASKSSVLEAVYLASAYTVPEDPLRGVSKLDYLVQRRGRGTWDGERRFLWHNASADEPIVVELKTGQGEVAFEVLDLPKCGQPVRLVRGEEPAAQELGNTLLIDRNLLSGPAVVETSAWLAAQAEGLSDVTARILRDEFESNAELFCAAHGNGCRLAVNTAGAQLALDELGDGAKSVVLTILSLAYKPRVLLIEEPESHLHPAALYAFTSALAELSRKLGFQVIATTHSAELVWMASKAVGADASVIYLERTGGTLDARVLSAEEAMLLAKLGIDVRLLYVF